MENTDNCFSVSAFAVSDIGQRRGNEDSWLVDERQGVFIVADGMGGHARGEVASKFATSELDKVINMLKRRVADETVYFNDSVTSLASEETLIKYAILYINRRLYNENETILKDELAALGSDNAAAELIKRKRMGTTLVSLIIYEKQAYITHVGDSRAYRIADGKAVQLTQDHSWVSEKVAQGEITASEARTHKKRNVITRSVGFKNKVEPDISVVTINPPERFLLCSDGLSNMLDEKELPDLVGGIDAKTACEKMVNLAVDRGGKDNITALIVDIQKSNIARDKFGFSMPEYDTDM